MVCCKRILTTLGLIGVTAFSGAPVQAQDVAIDSSNVRIGRREYSPHLTRGFPQRVFWGDTHVHTSYSTDAGMLGNILGPDDAYRFARGEIVVSSAGVRARLIRPLDFLVIADHSENLGLAPMIAESNPDLLRTEFGRQIHGLVKSAEVFPAYRSGPTRRRSGTRRECHGFSHDSLSLAAGSKVLRRPHSGLELTRC